MVAELLVGRGVADLIAEARSVGLDHKSVVVLVYRFLADNMSLRDADGESNGLAAPFHSICRRVVSTPAGTQPFLVTELLGTFDVDDAR